MRRPLGQRARFGVIVPATNTVVEHDYNVMRPRGVTCHTGRMFIEDTDASSDEAFEHLMHQMRNSLDDAVRDVMSVEPDHLIMGMSSETFWGGQRGNAAFIESVRGLSSLGVTTGADACIAALEVLDLQRVALLTPYQPIADREVVAFLSESGIDVVAVEGLRCRSATEIAAVDEDALREVLWRLNEVDAECILQVGTNLSMLRLADEAERWLGKPVLAINSVTMWRAVRQFGIRDQFAGAGVLFREY